MKKIIFLLFVLFTIKTISINVLANTPIKVLIDNQPVVFDVQPIIINDRTMVPLRAIFEALGATVHWDGETNTVKSQKNNTAISLTVDNNIMYVNDKPKTLDAVPTLKNDRILVPLRAVSEAFDCRVEWDSKEKNVLITVKKLADIECINSIVEEVNFMKTLDLNCSYYLNMFISNPDDEIVAVEGMVGVFLTKDDIFSTFTRLLVSAYNEAKDIQQICAKYDNLKNVETEITKKISEYEKLILNGGFSTDEAEEVLKEIENYNNTIISMLDNIK